MPKPIRQSPSTRVAPFSVKRKQINFNLLDTPISRNSSLHSIHPTTSSEFHSTSHVAQLEQDISQLKKQLDQANKELQTTRHQNRLFENERAQFEANIIEKCSKEKHQVELELRILKETHVEKVQSLSATLNHLSGTIAFLRDQLKRHNIPEEQPPTNQEELDHLIASQSNYKKDAQFIQDAYFKVKQETQIHHPLWSNLQNTTLSIKREIDDFHAWKSIPVADLARLLRDDQKNSTTTVRSLLFGRLKERGTK